MQSSPLLPYGFARKQRLLLVENEQGIDALFTDRTAPAALVELERICQRPFSITRLDEESFEEQLAAAYQAFNQQGIEAISELDDVVDLDKLADQIPESEDLLESQDDAPIIRLINALFTEALNHKASDIHIESFERSMSVRLRIDGVLQEILTPSQGLAPLLVSRIKVMAKLDIAEKRLPQDGRVSLRIGGRALDVRVSTIPSMHGERVVMRLLDKQASRMDLHSLGMPQAIEARFSELLQQPNGIILVTGPTGSGKTTTLYAGLTQLNSRHRNILTVEDPIEYALEGVGQTQVNAKTGMTFAKGLRAILRQDPDIVMIGEIRDKETAQIAVQASLTGHLVLSTLHTNDSIGAITRLIDIGIEPYLIASSLKGVLAQRLVRTLCQHCKQPGELGYNDALSLGDSAACGQTIFEAGGCEQCKHTGYSGRKGLYELLVIDKDLSRLIHDRASEHLLASQAADNLSTMLDEGRALVLAGETSAAEVLRMVKESSQDAVV
ncbi:type II secretion system ATPase GspE [Marinobacterium jannaschii]|uniref:type II secretion system ATPase GspE n=1 Tax=Marinobacterium jannaschii TaxID=64970 RepID=UPI000488C9B7|nr:type II secretion system ATPase GspE [Marinobacterium jannaschii]